MNRGTITQIIGVVVDVRFEDKLPNLYSALETKLPDGQKLVLEVEQHLGANLVRTVAMSTTDGLSRGNEVIDLGSPITVPVGPEPRGRMFNVVGEPIDLPHRQAGGDTPFKSKKRYPIHRSAPDFTKQSTKSEVLETGIKVIDLICPFLKGGKIGLFGGAGVGKTVLIQELIRNIVA